MYFPSDEKNEPVLNFALFNEEKGEDFLQLTAAPMAEPELAARVGLVELQHLLLAPEFRQRFVEAQLAPVLREKALLERRIYEKLIFPLQINAIQTEQPDIDRKQAKQLAREESIVTYQNQTFDIRRPRDVITLRQAVIEKYSYYQNRYDAVNQRAEAIRTQSHNTASRLLNDLAALSDAKPLLAALELWGRSRNSYGDTNNESGYHAGVIHYFEYRSVSEKNKRFYGNKFESCSLQHFIDVSESFRPFIRSSPQEAARLAHSYVAISDESGRSRVFIRTDSALLVAFQHSEQPLRLLSFIPNKPGWEQREDTAHRIEKELSSEGNDNRFNRLGTGRKLEFYSARKL